MSAATPTVDSEVSRGLSQSLQANADILHDSEIGRGHFMSHTFQFVVIRHPTVYSAKKKSNSAICP